MADYQSFDGHGVDVAVNRADDLDRKCLAYIALHSQCKVVELGSGAGGQSLRMAQAGAQVVAVDQFNFSQQFASYKLSNLKFVLGDMMHLDDLLSGQSFDIAVCQRTIHYLPYQTAVATLSSLRSLVTTNLYISVTGIGSLIGDVYDAATQPLPSRFSKLSELGVEMFSIYEPVCLYSESEFKELLTAAGWQVDECWVSAFGNIKAVCSNSTL